MRPDVIRNGRGEGSAGCGPRASGRGWRSRDVERRGAVGDETFPRAIAQDRGCRRACAIRASAAGIPPGVRRMRVAADEDVREGERGRASLRRNSSCEGVRPQTGTRGVAGQIRLAAAQASRQCSRGQSGGFRRLHREVVLRYREAHHLQTVRRRPASGAPRCQGLPAGTQRTRSKPRISTASCARRRCPKCTGSKVPPMMPIGALFRGAPARRRSGVFFRKRSGADLAAAEDHVFLRGETLQAHGPSRVQLVGRPISAPRPYSGSQRKRQAFTGPSSIHLAQNRFACAVLGHDRVGAASRILPMWATLCRGFTARTARWAQDTRRTNPPRWRASVRKRRAGLSSPRTSTPLSA